MNATNLDELRSGGRHVTDEKMEQVREILFGEYQRNTEAHVALLEQRVRELELSLHRRLDALQARMEAMAAEMDAVNRSAFDEIAEGMQDLAARVRRIPRG